MSRAATAILGAAAALLFVVGVALAVIQPGDLGDDDGDETALPTTVPTVPTTEPAPTSTSAVGPATTVPTVTTTPGGGSATTVPSGAVGGGETPRNGGGSGLGSSGAGDAGTDTLVDTGIELLPVPGLAALAGGTLLLRRRRA